MEITNLNSMFTETPWVDEHDPFIENAWPFECDPSDELMGEGELFDKRAFMFRCKKNGKYYAFQVAPTITCVYADENEDAVFCDVGPETTERIRFLKDHYHQKVKIPGL